MNRAVALFASGLAVLLLSGPAIAKDQAGSSSTEKAAPGTTAAPAEKPGVLSMPHRVTGRVVAVDQKANSVAVRDKDGKELTLVADAETAAELGRLKAGDQVKITYKKSKDQMVATKITTTK